MVTLIKNGTMFTGSDTVDADILVKDGKISLIGSDLKVEPSQIIDASGKYVLPGAIDVHTHLDMPFAGTVTSDDFYTGTLAAAAGGTTCVIDFCIQRKGQSLRKALEEWHAKAEGKAVIDYAFHVAISDVNEGILAEMPHLIKEEGVSSFKCFMAYKNALMVDDEKLFRVLLQAKESGALVGVHAENGDVIDFLARKMVADGKTDPIYHALSRPAECESEATGRAISLARMAQAPLYIFHLSARQALERVREARREGLPVYAETCPHYLFLTEDLLKEPDFEGAKYVMSPPLRSKDHQEPLWHALITGDLQVVATDHGAFNFKGQKNMGRGDFTKIPNGVPGIQERLLLIYNGGVLARGMTLNRMVELLATNPAKLFGLYPRKGTLSIGSDADIVILDPNGQSKFSAPLLKANVDYTAYEGLVLRGKVDTVLSRGVVVVKGDDFVGQAGKGRYIKRGPPIFI